MAIANMWQSLVRSVWGFPRSAMLRVCSSSYTVQIFVLRILQPVANLLLGFVFIALSRGTVWVVSLVVAGSVVAVLGLWRYFDVSKEIGRAIEEVKRYSSTRLVLCP